jgi:hypothetical protein
MYSCERSFPSRYKLSSFRKQHRYTDGSFGVFNPEGEQGFFGQITGGRISGNAFMLQGTITEGGLSSCPANITITGNCGSNAQIIFSTVRHEIFVTAKGQVTCSG